jgi:hypothetical protein
VYLVPPPSLVFRHRPNSGASADALATEITLIANAAMRQSPQSPVTRTSFHDVSRSPSLCLHATARPRHLQTWPNPLSIPAQELANPFVHRPKGSREEG